MSGIVPIGVIAVMVAFNALYVAAEFATVASRRSRVQDAAASGSGIAARLLVILRDPRHLDNYVAACQVGITLSSLVAGAYGQAQLTPLLEPVFGDAGRTVAVLIVLVSITAMTPIGTTQLIGWSLVRRLGHAHRRGECDSRRGWRGG